MSKINAQNLSMESLPLVRSGLLAAQFDALIRATVRDCHERPALEKGRKITLEITLTPRCDDRGNMDMVAADFGMKSTIPGFSVEGDPMLPRGEDRLLFQPLSPSDPRQDALPLGDNETVDPETGEVRRVKS